MTYRPMSKEREKELDQQDFDERYRKSVIDMPPTTEEFGLGDVILVVIDNQVMEGEVINIFKNGKTKIRVGDEGDTFAETHTVTPDNIKDIMQRCM